MQFFDLEAATPSLTYPAYLDDRESMSNSDLNFDLAFSDAYDLPSRYVPLEGLKAKKGLELLIESNSNGMQGCLSHQTELSRNRQGDDKSHRGAEESI
jgi:hypothetical protein